MSVRLFQTQTLAAAAAHPPAVAGTACLDEREKATDATAAKAAATAAAAAAPEQPHRFRNAHGPVAGASGRQRSVVARRVPERLRRRRCAATAAVVGARRRPPAPSPRSQLSLRLAAARRDGRLRGPAAAAVALVALVAGQRRVCRRPGPVARERRRRVSRRPAGPRGDDPYVTVTAVPAQPLLRPESNGRVSAAPPPPQPPALRPSRRQVPGVPRSRDRAAGQRAKRRVPWRPRSQRPSLREQHESKKTLRSTY